MLKPFEVHIQAESLTRFAPVLGEARWRALQAQEQARVRMAGRTFWNVNSTRAAAAWRRCCARCSPTRAAPASTRAGW